MASDNNQRAPPVEELQRRFADLWSTIRQDGETVRAPEEQLLLIDQVRNALDRGSDRLMSGKSPYIADTFAIEKVAYRSDTTELLKLRHRDLGSFHALKTVPAARAADTPLVERLRREGEIAIGLRDQRIAETSVLLRLSDGRPALLQNWYDCSLKDFVGTEADNALDAWRVIERILEALLIVHAHGYVHCDLTPANILVPQDDPAKAVVCDFGICLPIGQRHCDIGVRLAGSPEFVAPEQASGEPAEPMQDIYAVGRLASYLIDRSTGSADTALQRFATLCTEPDKGRRPPSAQEALAALAEIRG